MRHGLARWTLAAGTILALTAIPTAGGAPEPAIEGVSIGPDAVTVTVANRSGDRVSGSLVVRYRFAGAEGMAVAPIVLEPGATVPIRVETVAPALAVIACGVVVDDGVPF